MSEIIERVARALHEAWFKAGFAAFPLQWDALNAVEQNLFLVLARAAIEAMREPTQAMWDAGFDVYPHHTDEIWSAMIDAALESRP